MCLTTAVLRFTRMGCPVSTMRFRMMRSGSTACSVPEATSSRLGGPVGLPVGPVPVAGVSLKMRTGQGGMLTGPKTEATAKRPVVVGVWGGEGMRGGGG